MVRPDPAPTAAEGAATAAGSEVADRPDVGDGSEAGRRQQRVSAYGILRDGSDRLLLVRAAPYLTVAGRWFLPGGGVEHGEAPLDALRREVAEESGLVVGDATLAGVLSDTWPIPDGTLLHTVRLIYRVERWEGTLRSEAQGSSDLAQWFRRAELDGVPLVRYAREALATYG
jgi:8-oxo-dGTP diphosphatase